METDKTEFTWNTWCISKQEVFAYNVHHLFLFIYFTCVLEADPDKYSDASDTPMEKTLIIHPPVFTADWICWI